MLVTTKELFNLAYGKYAIGAFNINNAEQAVGLFRGAQKAQAPIIVQISRGSRKYIGVNMIQHMIQELGLNIEGIHRMQALLPCWDLLPCKAEIRNSCPAYKDNTRPCWMLKGLDCVAQGNECRRCVVYRFGSLCTEDIKRLLHDQNDVQDAGTAMKELMQRKRHSKEEDS